MKKLRIGIDYDGVITAHHERFKWLADIMLMSGHEVHVITGRRDSDREQTINELKEYGLHYSDIHFFPGKYRLKLPLPLEVTQEIGSWKAAACLDIGVDMLFDDSFHRYDKEEFNEIGMVHV